MKNYLKFYLSIAIFTLSITSTIAQDNVYEYIKEFPNQEQVKMMSKWLENNEKGTFWFSGLVDPTDNTVVTPQATVDYGYNWFSISDAPAIVNTPEYDKFFSVSIFDMKHNVPAVIVNPKIPIVLIRPGQKVPEGDFHIVKLETDQGLIFTRMVVVDNMEKVRELSESIVMEGGKGDMNRNVQRFSKTTITTGNNVFEAVIPNINWDYAFPKISGGIDPITLGAAVYLGQLGTPSDAVRYDLIVTDENGDAFSATDTYVFTVPAGIVKKGGYMSITVYGSDNKLLIPNKQKIYDRTTYSSEQNSDGTYTITLSPKGKGLNGIPTGKPFYAVIRAYVPVQGADLTVKVTKK